MLVILRGSGICALLSASHLLRQFGNAGLRVILVGYRCSTKTQRPRAQWAIAPILGKFGELEDAMYHSGESSVMFLEEVRRMPSGDLLVGPAALYGSCALYEKRSLELWFLRSLKRDERVQFVPVMECHKNLRKTDHIVIDVNVLPEKLVPHWNVHWKGIHIGGRLPHIVALDSKKQVQTHHAGSVVIVNCDDQLTDAMEVARRVSGCVDAHIRSFRWTRL